MKDMIKQLLAEAGSRLPRYGLDEEQTAALTGYFRMTAERDDLLDTIVRYYTELYASQSPPSSVENYPEGDGLECGMLFAAIYYVRCELLESVLAERGIPAYAVKKVPWHFRDLLTRSRHCYGEHGFRGMYRSGMIRYTYPRSYTLGRLSFEMTTFFGPYEVYRNKKDSTLIPMALPDIRYLPDGRQAPRDYTGEYYCTKLSADSRITGNTFHEDGTLDFTTVSLDENEYEKVLGKGVPVISVHVPGNEKLTAESVDESFAVAGKFFAQFYPDCGFRAYICSSWLLDTGLKKLLGNDSNILKFQSRFRIVLSSVNGFALYWNIFGIERPIPRTELIPRNAFQRGILKMLDEGGRLYSGNGFILM